MLDSKGYLVGKFWRALRILGFLFGKPSQLRLKGTFNFNIWLLDYGELVVVEM